MELDYLQIGFSSVPWIRCCWPNPAQLGVTPIVDRIQAKEHKPSKSPYGSTLCITGRDDQHLQTNSANETKKKDIVAFPAQGRQEKTVISGRVHSITHTKSAGVHRDGLLYNPQGKLNCFVCCPFLARAYVTPRGSSWRMQFSKQAYCRLCSGI